MAAAVYNLAVVGRPAAGLSRRNSWDLQLDSEAKYMITNRRPQTDSGLRTGGDLEKESRGLKLKRVQSATLGSGCIRVQSAVDPELRSEVRTLSRACCDVLGPLTCRECSRLQRREWTFSHRSLPQAFLTETQCTSAVLASRSLPHIPNHVIEEQVLRGEITDSDFRARVSRCHSSSIRAQSAPAQTRRQAEHFGFFINIRDLNEKLRRGYNPFRKNQRPSTTGRRTPLKPNANLGMAGLQVTPKKKFHAFYEPPLVLKTAQNAEPAFFAGSNVPYKLPERLADDVIPMEEVNLGEPRIQSSRTSSARPDSTNLYS